MVCESFFCAKSLSIRFSVSSVTFYSSLFEWLRIEVPLQFTPGNFHRWFSAGIGLVPSRSRICRYVSSSKKFNLMDTALQNDSCSTIRYFASVLANTLVWRHLRQAIKTGRKANINFVGIQLCGASSLANIALYPDGLLSIMTLAAVLAGVRQAESERFRNQKRNYSVS